MRWEAKLNTSVDDGHSVSAHLKQAVKAGAISPEELEGPPCPDVLWYLWEYFNELNIARDSGMNGIGSIGWSDIMSWALLTRRCILPYEAQALVIMDAAYRAEIMKGVNEASRKSTKPSAR